MPLQYLQCLSPHSTHFLECESDASLSHVVHLIVSVDEDVEDGIDLLKLTDFLKVPLRIDGSVIIVVISILFSYRMYSNVPIMSTDVEVDVAYPEGIAIFPLSRISTFDTLATPKAFGYVVIFPAKGTSIRLSTRRWGLFSAKAPADNDNPRFIFSRSSSSEISFWLIILEAEAAVVVGFLPSLAAIDPRVVFINLFFCHERTYGS